MAKYFDKFTQDGTDECVNSKTFAVFYSNKEEQVRNMHIHDCCEVFLCLSNGQEFLIGDSMFSANRNDMLVVNQFEIHKLLEKPGVFCERYVFKLHPRFLLLNSTSQTDLSGCFYDRVKFKRQVSLTDEQAMELISIFNSFKRNDDFGDDIMSNVNAIKATVLINRYLSCDEAPDSILTYTSNAVVQSVVAYINDNLFLNINLDELSKKHYISKNHLCRIFKKHTGTTVVNYITLRRIAEAKKFLNEGYDVKDTCEKCGFNDYSHFIRTFKNIVGVPPKQYIKRKE